jgi:hypothetical protein
MSSLIALWTLFAEAYLILWDKRMWEPLNILYDKIPLLEWKWIDIVHVFLWLLTLFFGMIAYATVREEIESPAGWWDFLGAILIIAIFLFLIFNEWITLLFVILSALQVFYFYSSIGKS